MAVFGIGGRHVHNLLDRHRYGKLIKSSPFQNKLELYWPQTLVVSIGDNDITPSTRPDQLFEKIVKTVNTLKERYHSINSYLSTLVLMVIGKRTMYAAQVNAHLLSVVLPIPHVRRHHCNFAFP